MKKLAWLLALTAAFVFVTGCPGIGDPSETPGETPGGNPPGGNTPDEDVQFWLASDETGEVMLANNKKTLVSVEENGTGYVHIFFVPYGKTFDKIEIDFEITGMLNLMWQCAYDENGTWSRSSTDLDFIDTTDGSTGPYQARPVRVFNGDSWGLTEKGEASGAKKLDLATMKGVCIQIPNVDGEVFTLKNFKFIE